MSSLTSALNWYHKKIGAYDKELWEKSVDQRILRGVCAIPKRTTRIKTELIDVDLVRGSAFVKAKPQHSWIAATISGIKRVFFLPFFYSWWKLQTNALVSCILVILYFLQIIATFLYFSANEKEFPDVPVSEILTPAAMTFILGIVHSQIVATFSSTKTQKNVTREKRRKLKCKRVKKPVNYDHESKSSPDSASDDRHDILDVSHLRKTSNDNCDKEVTPSVNESCTQCHPCGCKKFYKNGQHLRFSFEDNSKANFSNEESNVDSNFIQPPENCINVDDFKNSKTHLLKSSLLSTEINSEQWQTQHLELNHCNSKSNNSHISRPLKNNFAVKNHLECSKSDIIDISLMHPQSSSNMQVGNDTLFFKESCNRSSVDRENENFSSDEDFFIARKSSGSREHWTNYSVEMKNSCHVSKLCSKSHQSLNSVASRRYSDGGLSYKQRNYHAMFLSLQRHRHSVDNILIDDHVLSDGEESAAVSLKDNPKISESGIPSLGLRNRKNGCQGNIPCALKLPINIKNFSSSCDSCTETSPNTPSKPHTSDLEWPLITNTDCNSDSTDCSTQCSEGNASDISPSENPFAWEIQEPSKKPSNVGHSGSDKVSCTIWEHNECKKADLTALDISSAIIQKVDSSQHSSEYLYIGVFFAIVLSLLPLLFRLRNGVSTYIVQDVSTDVLTLTVPSSEEVVKITDGLLDVMLGSGWRVKFVTLIMLVERFTLSLAYFFLLSVAEKTFKQRFLYAKHFCYLTSSRRAKRSDLPHFRLNKVRNIKIWLSIRSYMKKLGPQRSVDVIVSIAFILEVCVVSFLCIQLLKETGQFADKLHCWELLFWTLSLGTFLLRFMVIGTKINKKYRNLSVLITEQINLYLHMEQKPHKKEELILANNVLKLAADLLKELESPFKISGLCANSYLYNITKVVVLSAFSAVLTDVLGFKLKLYKIKIK
ncbi:putative homeodomain transcription factor 2 [Trichonephila inaurata madagascariensis]|uniref:Putative homeodomain transcription factor 2 n=1 Tax=Trichonephila inaurata madagascariensis TaxID=2747483 RepID=A0A8X6WZV4_9ARAC|nr:putative homeodomain transcription factor 2 [Trichonephila inaurata madagascariensis]